VLYDFHGLLVATKSLTAKLRSRYAKVSGVGVANFGKSEL